MKNLPEVIYFPGSDYTIEKNTEELPSRGRYYIVRSRNVIGKGYTKLAAAQEAIKPLLEAINWKPPAPVRDLRDAGETLREEMNWIEEWRSEIFLSEAGHHS